MIQPSFLGDKLLTKSFVFRPQNTLGLSRGLSFFLSGVVGLEFWLASFIAIPLIDRIGRWPLLLLEAIGQCVSMVIIASTVA